MKRNPIPSHILRLDGGNASRIAKRVGRSEATVKRWMRDGIPTSAREDCKAALARHQRALQAAKTRKVAAVKKPSPKRRTAKPVIVPMTAREKAQVEIQRQLFRQHIEWLKAKIELEKRRKKNKVLKTKHGRNKADRFFLEDMVDQDEDIWIAFLNEADELGLSLHDARQSFFSPKIR